MNFTIPNNVIPFCFFGINSTARRERAERERQDSHSESEPRNQLCWFRRDKEDCQAERAIRRKDQQEQWIVEIVIPKNHPDLDLNKEYFLNKYPFSFMHSTERNIGYVCATDDIVRVKEEVIEISKKLHQNKIPTLRILALKSYINEMKLFFKNKANVSIDEFRQFV